MPDAAHVVVPGGEGLFGVISRDGGDGCCDGMDGEDEEKDYHGFYFQNCVIVIEVKRI